MCTLCDSTNINTIIEFVSNCLQHVSGDGFSGGSDSYLQFWDTCGKRRNINLILYVTPQKEITWGCIWRMRWQVVKTPTIISNNTVYIQFSTARIFTQISLSVMFIRIFPLLFDYRGEERQIKNIFPNDYLWCKGTERMKNQRLTGRRLQAKSSDNKGRKTLQTLCSLCLRSL